MFSTRDMIDIAVQIEHNGERVYREASKKTMNPELISLLNWLADEEAAHADRFQQLKKIPQRILHDDALEKMGRDILTDMMEKQSFSLNETDLAGAQGVRDLMDLAVEFEEDTILFYELLRPFIEDEQAGEELDQIIAEEEAHIQKLLDYTHQ